MDSASVYATARHLSKNALGFVKNMNAKRSALYKKLFPSTTLPFLALALALIVRGSQANSFQHHRHAPVHDCVTHQYSFSDAERNLEKLQDVLDAAVGRHGLVGNVAWLTTMSMYFWNVARKPTVANVCEVGFGCGHSATIFLSSSAQSRVISFDLFPDGATEISKDSEMGIFHEQLPIFQRAGLGFIAEAFSGRHEAVPGNSSETIPAYVAAHPEFKCDLIYIDGSHQEVATLSDIRNFRSLAHPDTLVLIDDLEFPAVEAAVSRAIDERTLAAHIECISGEVTINRRFGPPASLWPDLGKGKKFCLTKYANSLM